MAVYTTSTLDINVTFTPDGEDNDYDLLVGSRLIHEGGGYIIDINGTRLFLGFVPKEADGTIDDSVTWLPNDFLL